MQRGCNRLYDRRFARNLVRHHPAPQRSSCPTPSRGRSVPRPRRLVDFDSDVHRAARRLCRRRRLLHPRQQRPPAAADRRAHADRRGRQRPDRSRRAVRAGQLFAHARSSSSPPAAATSASSPPTATTPTTAGSTGASSIGLPLTPPFPRASTAPGHRSSGARSGVGGRWSVGRLVGWSVACLGRLTQLTNPTPAFEIRSIQ